MTLLNRETFLGANKRRFRLVDVPDGIELPDGGITNATKVRIRSLTEREMASFEMSNVSVTKSRDKVLVSQAAMESHRRRLVQLVLVDDSGNTLLTDQDRDALESVDGILIQAVYLEACKHCGLKESDESEKNSRGTPDAAAIGV